MTGIEAVQTPSPGEEEDLIVWDEKDSIGKLKEDPSPRQGDTQQSSSPIPRPELHLRSSSSSSISTQQPREQGSIGPPRRRSSALAAANGRKRKLNVCKAIALENFDRWAEGVQKRVFEVVNSRESGSAGAKGARGGNGPPLPDNNRDGDGTFSKSDEADLKLLQSLYPPIEPPTPLLDLPFETREKILHSLLLLVLSLEHYDARSRVLLHIVSSTLSLPPRTFLELESLTASTLISAAHISATAESQKAIEANKTSKRWKVGLASVAGAAVIGLTGGLAAPLVAAGIGGLLSGIGLGATVAATYLGAVAGSGAIVGALFGAYGGKMTGEMVARYASEVEDFAFIPLKNEASTNTSSPGQRRNPRRPPPPTTFDQIAIKAASEPDKKLLVTIGISGWLTSPEDITRPWRCLSPRSSSLYALRFDPAALLDIGESLDTLLESYGWQYVQYEIVTRTVLATLYLALWPLVLVKAARVIDNPYSVARNRAEKAGRVLADALCNRVQGERPVNLVGFGLGARVVYYAMKELFQRDAFGIVQDVYLLGAPVHSDNKLDWSMLRAMAGGRVVNGYSGSDWVLGFLERGSSLGKGVAGLQEVNVFGVENVNLGGDKAGKQAIVEGHARYGEVMGLILRECGFGGLNELEEEEVTREGVVLEKLREKTRKDMQAVEKEEQEKELRRKEKEVIEEKKAKEKKEKAEAFSAMREAMQRETEKRKQQEVENDLRDLVMDEPMKELHPTPIDEDEDPLRRPSMPASSSSGTKVGDWTEREDDGIDDVVDRIERELIARRQKRLQKGRG